MKLLVAFCATLGVVATAGGAQAQVSQLYTYDGNGRLTDVTTTGSGGTNTAAYAYDDADNRTSRSRTGTAAYAALLSLPVNDALQPNEALVSPDGRFSFALRPSGRLELWLGEAPAAAGGSPAMVAAFRLTDDGQARFVSLRSAVVPPGVRVSLGDDGQLALLDTSGAEVWHSGDATDHEAGQ
jgi:YD repeat-containing protein